MPALVPPDVWIKIIAAACFLLKFSPPGDFGGSGGELVWPICKSLFSIFLCHTACITRSTNVNLIIENT